MQIGEDSRPEHDWCQLAPNTEDSRSHAEQHGTESLTEISEQDLIDNALKLQLIHKLFLQKSTKS